MHDKRVTVDECMITALSRETIPRFRWREGVWKVEGGRSLRCSYGPFKCFIRGDLGLLYMKGPGGHGFDPWRERYGSRMYCWLPCNNKETRSRYASSYIKRRHIDPMSYWHHKKERDNKVILCPVDMITKVQITWSKYVLLTKGGDHARSMSYWHNLHNILIACLLVDTRTSHVLLTNWVLCFCAFT